MMHHEPFRDDDIVKSCCKLESGLNLSVQGLRACTRGALMPPLFCSAKDLAQSAITRDIVVEKRKEYIRMLNDDYSDMDCKRCLMVSTNATVTYPSPAWGISTCRALQHL